MVLNILVNPYIIVTENLNEETNSTIVCWFYQLVYLCIVQLINVENAKANTLASLIANAVVITVTFPIKDPATMELN